MSNSFKADEDELGGQEEISLDANNDDNNNQDFEVEEETEATAEVESPASEEQRPPAAAAEQASPPPQQQQQSDKPASDSKFFAIRTTGGQERMVADMLYTKVMSKKVGVRSVMVLDSFKGYIIVEAPDSNVAYEALAGIRHVRGQIRGDLPFKDIEGYLIKKPTVTELSVDDTVEVIAGPFKGMKAKITRVDYEKQEATVVLLDSPYQIPVTVDANYLKKSTA
jgi:transcriptional antiterminator NusG